jgi:hypothetical protein
MSDIVPGDMVVLIKIAEDSSGYGRGLRPGMVGTVIAWSSMPGFKWLVTFPLSLCNCDSGSLRKIEPPEAGDWKYCIWKPERELTV